MTNLSDGSHDGSHQEPPDLGACLQQQAPIESPVHDVALALVERIADVDDDRRRSVGLLQKAFAAHRDETFNRFRRTRNGLLTALALVVALGVVTTLWLGLELAQQRTRASTAINALQAQIVDLQAVTGRPADGLSERVDGIATALAELTRQVEAIPTDAVAALRGDLDLQLAALATAQEPMLADAVASQVAQARADLEAGVLASIEQLREQLEAMVGAAPDAASQVDLSADPQNGDAALAATVSNQLLDERLTQIEREHQQLVAALAMTEGTERATAAVTSADAVTADAAPTAAPATEAPAPPEDAPPDAPRDTPQDAPQTAVELAADATSDAPRPDAEPETIAAATAGSSLAAPSASDGSLVVGDRLYALQLIGFYSRDERDVFIANYPLPPAVYGREEMFRGRPWFVLIHSLYADPQEANAAIAELPEVLQKLNAWVRPLNPETELDVIITASARP